MDRAIVKFVNSPLYYMCKNFSQERREEEREGEE